MGFRDLPVKKHSRYTYLVCRLREKNVAMPGQSPGAMPEAGLGGMRANQVNVVGTSGQAAGAGNGHGKPGVVLSAGERAAVAARAKRDLLRTIFAQGLMALVAALVAWGVAGPAAGVSALAGAGAYFIPNACFGLRLLLDIYRPGGANPFTFLFGEVLKLGLTVLLLWAIVRVGGDHIVWPALLVGLLCALKGYVLLLMFRKLS
ncbi:ATP synthase subunit I [Orrella dioscoreae]|uniref:ATP synthase subunit I n=1 Tax=Orrella dioscoreae TaxID=1851544 RepID=UPI002F912578